MSTAREQVKEKLDAMSLVEFAVFLLKMGEDISGASRDVQVAALEIYFQTSE